MIWLRVSIVLLLLTNCKAETFCDCYLWRAYLIESYQKEMTDKEEGLIEFEMKLFDNSCFDFQDYTSAIETQEELDMYFKLVEECE
jgi:hypothetical protein